MATHGKKTSSTKPPPIEDEDDLADAIDAEDPDVLRPAGVDGIRPPARATRRAEELEKAVAATRTGAPVVPYPPELSDKYKPYWRELVNSFPKDHFNQSDYTLLKMWCRTAYDVDRMTLAIEEEGDVVLGGRGPVINPRIKARNVAEALLLSLAVKFRAQPASRTNTENHKTRTKKSESARRGAQAIDSDEDGLLAGGGPMH